MSKTLIRSRTQRYQVAPEQYWFGENIKLRGALWGVSPIEQVHDAHNLVLNRVIRRMVLFTEHGYVCWRKTAVSEDWRIAISPIHARQSESSQKVTEK